MSRRITRMARAAFAAVVGAGLTFGAGSAFAAARPLCPWAPESGYIGTACSTQQTCWDACSAWWGSWNAGVCGDGCCICNV